ncbi:hypothetical protein FKG94_23245 [Exilibacterium tricleocarpae]|uniref:Uncharacterized protein n=1 Tax=Exilibacterium tricleocarpae TaxID=2591008 RepID=A0A545SXP0_9GAMM|nr:hypothetical protein [Exilibacterium tricleocarpae]TQV69709.1 hypothetical protein FKG94_23245 [Exilibacterium tricleocarpae]
MKKFILIIFTLTILSLPTFSATEFYGNVKGFYVNSSGVVLVTLDNGSTTPECGNSWQFTFSVSDNGAKEWISMLLTARASGSIIKVGYGPNPSGSCSVQYFYFQD